MTLRIKLEQEANEALNRDLTVVTKETTYEQLGKECGFVPPNLPKNKVLRMIRIGNFPPMPDGGVHVKYTKEIGEINIINIISGDDSVNIRYKVTN